VLFVLPILSFTPQPYCAVYKQDNFHLYYLTARLIQYFTFFTLLSTIKHSLNSSSSFS
jgi:hypothetical protein